MKVQRSTSVALAHWDAYELAFRLSTGEERPLAASVLPAMHAASVEGLVLAVGGDSDDHIAHHDDALLGSLIFQDAVLAEIERTPGAELVRDATGLAAARADGTAWFLLALEGTRPLRGRMEALHAFHRMGVRVLGLTWNGRTEVADGVGVRNPGGLTEFGHEVLAEATRLGMVIDVSHMAPRGLHDVLAATEAPVMASHSNARAITDHRRNLDDDELRAIASVGGIVGLNFLPWVLSSERPVRMDDIVRHIAHLIETIGIEHVALGGDFTYDPWRTSVAKQRSFQGVAVDYTPGERTPVHEIAELPLLVDALEVLGLDETDTALLLHGNLLRLLNERLP